jgi:hypothetical protein
MDGTILGQGTFTSSYTGANPNPGNATVQAANSVIIQIPSAADWLKVTNFTQWGNAGNDAAYFNGTDNAYIGFQFFWQRGMAAGTGTVMYYSNGANSVNGDTLLTGGFTPYDPSGQEDPAALPLVGPAVATTASTNATRPVVSTGNTAGISVGTIVRLSNTAQSDVNGIDMVVGAVTANANFTLLTATNALATAPGAIGGAGFYRIVNYNSLFYPRRRYVTNITQASNAQVSTTIPHGLTPGQLVRFEIPVLVPNTGMSQLNGVQGTILSVVDDYNFTVNVNTTNFNAFTWPTIAQQPSSFPAVVPFGEDTANALAINAAQVPTIGGQQIFNTNTGILADSTVNTGYLGMILGFGGNGNSLGSPIIGPAGTVSFNSSNVITKVDTLYWVAGKSTYGGL